MGWLTSKEHQTNPKMVDKLGTTHTDTYHVNDAGKRDQPHHTDLKVSGPKFEPSMKDIHHPTDKK